MFNVNTKTITVNKAVATNNVATKHDGAFGDEYEGL
jgi:hypothetical protein